MRAFSLILACSLMLAGTATAGLADGGLPGIGTFHYSGPPIAGPAPLVVAAR